MATCPNKTLQSWKDLVNSKGEDMAYYLWDKYEGNIPESEYAETAQVKPGVSELFESNPELANAVYEALGFKGEKIIETAKGSTYRYLPSGKTQRFKKVEGKEYEPQDILTFVPNYEWIKSNNPQWLEKQGLENDTQYTQYLLEKVQGKDKVWIVDSKGKKIETNQDAKTADRLFIAFGKKDGTVEDFIPVSKEPVIGFYTYDSRIHFDEKGERYRDRHLGNKVVKITEGITPQQKQQAQQLYSQYLDTKNRLYRSETSLRPDETKAPDWLKEQPEIIAQQEAQGRWFYKSLKEAQEHLTKFEGDKITYIDVDGDVEQYNARDNKFAGGYGREGREYFVSKELAKSRTELGSKQDIEGFKEFVKSPEGITTSPETDELSLYLSNKMNENFKISNPKLKGAPSIDDIVTRHVPTSQTDIDNKKEEC